MDNREGETGRRRGREGRTAVWRTIWGGRSEDDNSPEDQFPSPRKISARISVRLLLGHALSLVSGLARDLICVCGEEGKAGEGVEGKNESG